MTDYIIAMLESIQESLDDPTTLALPDPTMVAYYENLRERRLWIDIDVGMNMLEFARNIIQWNIEDSRNGIPIEERKPIWIYLFNYGGSADFMWMFIDVISKSETPIYTVNMGKCSSAAALIFITGHKRLMLPSATVLIHQGAGSIEGDAVKVIDQAESYKEMIKRMHTYILGHTEIPQGTLSRKKNNDWELDSESCLKYGVCDSVIETISDIF